MGTGNTPQLVRGMKDVLPQDQPFWDCVYEATRTVALEYGYGRIDTPIVEDTSLFNRTLGKTTDIIEKEMFAFEDQSGDRVVLRPEATASVARAYIKHGMLSMPQPVKLYYWGPMFRHDRPQAGRFRQFTQAGFEVFGETHPVVDAQMIELAQRILNRLGIRAIIKVNSIGCNACRPAYLQELGAYYKSHRSKLCNDCKRRLLKNPLRLLDCKEEPCQQLKAEAPQIVDRLCEACKEHFVKFLEYLDEQDIAYQLESTLVRGLDYYTRTVFEFYPENFSGSQDAILSGGRYDGLVEQLGGRPTPGIGFSMGIERCILQLKTGNAPVPALPKPKIFFAQLGDQARRKALKILSELRGSGLIIAESFVKDGLKAQLEIANRLGVAYTIILGQKEVLDGTVLLRDMEGGVQEIVERSRLGKELLKKIGELPAQSTVMTSPVASADTAGTVTRS